MKIKVLCMLSVLLICTQTFKIDNVERKITDESSLSNINEVQTYHFDLEIDLDFENNVIYGKQTLHMKTKAFAVDHVSLDIRDIDVKSVTDESGKALSFQINSEINPSIGQQLDIQIQSRLFTGSDVTLIIEYVTSKDASAVTWLTKEQTAGKKLPFMYTQCESIHCRSLAPLQDTPAIKATYSLYSKSPIDIIVRASGNITHEYIDEEKRHTKFEMTIPVQSYLLAFAGGNLIEHQLGPRTFVITEPELMAKSVSELEDLEKAVSAAEGYLTEYLWGTYKVLMLPSSFPYGGMENPLLTFANSALVTGDKSAFRLFVHELSHSWFGNLVTNENWSNFWLNEGFTVFLERKTDTILYGIESSKVSAKRGNSSMAFDIANFGADNNYTSLHPQLNGNHPDTSISGIPYEKGFQFLFYLESLVGEDCFQAFLQDYVRTFLKKSIIVDEFIDKFISHVKKSFKKDEAKVILDQIDWETWIYGPGFPPVSVDLETESYNNAINIANNYISGQSTSEDIDTYNSFDMSLKSIVLIEFLTKIDQVTSETVAKINDDLNVSAETNVQLISPWQQLAVRTGYEPSPFDSADAFVGAVGRYALIVPVFRAMQSIDVDQARAIFEKHKAFYHPITRGVIEDTFSAGQLARNDAPSIVDM